MHDTLRRLALPALALLACCGDDAAPPAPDGPADTTSPVIVQVRPAPGDTGVLLSAQVEVTFSEPLNWATVGPASFFLLHQAGLVAGTYAVEGVSAAFVPAAPLDSLTPYTVRLTRGLRDSAGNQLPADSTWSFRTGATARPVSRPEGPCERPACRAR